MNKKSALVVIIFMIVTGQGFSQELNAKVSVLVQRVTTVVDKKIFATLQNQLNNFMNNRKWTRDVFQQTEKIDCSFILNLENGAEPNIYKGTLTVQAARPVYNSSYQAALINFLDGDVGFKYVEFQPIEFNENRVQGTDAGVANLTALFAYYAYMIIGLDYNSFSPKGGQTYFRMAQNIITNAPEGRNIVGWRVFDGLRNRYWLNENFINTRYNVIHDIIYSYYRDGLDNLYEKEAEARSNILQTLVHLQSFNKENANTMVAEFFFQGKSQELIGIFKKGTAAQKEKVVEVLSALDVVNAAKYKQELR